MFSVTLFIIALASVSFGLYAMVLRRRMLAPETEEELADQTDVVAEEMKAGKAVPTLAAVPPAPGNPVPPAPSNAVPPAPVAGPDRSRPAPVPQRDSPMVGHRSSGTRTDGSTSMRFQTVRDDLGR